jgi:hypothetical protein
MKLIFSLVGVVIAWGIYKAAPEVFPALLGINSFSTVITGVATLLTAMWAIDLNRLSIFEKLDDLSASQKDVAIGKAGQFRGKIVFAMICNTLLLVALLIAVNLLLPIPELRDTIVAGVGYLLFVAIFFWLGGFIESWYCWHAIENSRLSLAAAQSANKQRQKYLDKMRDDEAKLPVSRTDSHLKGYTEDYKPC